jgi:hypothetical protein
MAGGADTNKGRLSGEAVLLSAFAARGVPSLAYPEWVKQRGSGTHSAGSVLVRGVPFVTIYQTKGHVEFVLMRDGEPEITIECKHQSVSGSCDEKLSYCLLNAIYQFVTRKSVLVLSGQHWQSARGMAATAAMRRMSALAAPAGREFLVLGQQEALNWISSNF